MIRAASTAATRDSVKFVSHYLVHVCRIVQGVDLFCGQECAWRCLIDVQQRSPLVLTVRWVLLNPSIAALLAHRSGPLHTATFQLVRISL